MTATDEKQQAHQLLDQLEPGQLAAVVHLLRVLTDSVTRAVANAPVDEEPLTTEAVKALDEARDWSKQNEGIPHDEVVDELGLATGH